MPIELEKQKLTLHGRLGSQSTQLLIEGDVIVPDIKPDIANILKLDSIVNIEEQKCDNGRISFKGALCANILYHGKKTERPINNMKAELPFEDFMNVNETEALMDTQVIPKLVHIDFKLLNDRKISIKAVVEIAAVWQNPSMHEAVNNAFGDNALQLAKGSLRASNVVTDIKDRFSIKEELALSGAKPNISELLETSARLSHKESKVIDGRISVKGDVEITALYIGESDDSVLEMAEFELPFNGFIDVKDAREDMMCMMNLWVSDVRTSVGLDDDGEARVIESEVVVGARAKLIKESETELVADAYLINRAVDIKKEPVEYMSLVGRNKATGMFKEVINIDGQYPEIMQVMKAWGEANVDNMSLKDDAIEMDGVANVKLMYVAKDDDRPATVLGMSIPFNQSIEIKGAKNGMSFDVNTDIEDISFNMLSEREVEIRLTLSFDAVVMKQEMGEIITDISEKEPDNTKKLASVVIYTVQLGDTLWKIAKRFNTTINDILKLNDIENPDLIYPGQKFLILKSCC